MLASKGADTVTLQFEAGVPSAVSFSIEINNQLVNFLMDTKWRGVLSCLNNDPKVEPRFMSNEHAQRVAWRVTKDWLEAQFARIEAQQADLVEVFLPYAVRPDGQTMYQAIANNNYQLLLGHDGG